ncbi:MAG: tRNA dihydrouridine synthase DusB, partial [Gammaproteobacteria bacterium]
FRKICRGFGAGMAVSEMISSKPDLRLHRRTRLKTDQDGEPEPRAVQILGADPLQMAETARHCVDQGAQIVDINMGCPAKKVCSLDAGSALLKNVPLVASILERVVKAVDVPVTLKIRTGWDLENRNAMTVAGLAEAAGIAALTIHGRTRACRFSGAAEYETIRRVKRAVKIPVIANGDIDSVEKARAVLQYTGADAVMIGRAAQGRPWIFEEINHFLTHGKPMPTPSLSAIRNILRDHLDALYCFYGEEMGVKIARKHLGWYFDQIGAVPKAFRLLANRASSTETQMDLVDSAFDFLTHERAA